MSAAELLRSLDKAATAGPWRWVDNETDKPRSPGDYCSSLRTVAEKVSAFGSRLPEWILDAEEMNGDGRADANAHLIATTRNLLTEIAALVEAVGGQQDAVEGDKMEDTGAISEPVWRAMMAVRATWQALNAKAAELVGR